VLKRWFVLDSLLASFAAIRVFFRCRAATAFEVEALRQQLAVLKRKRPRPPLTCCDRLFWITLRRFWSGWKDVLVLVKPDTVVAWHRAAFAGTGVGDLAEALAGRRSPRKSAS
jgi:hypothetical protein